MNHINEETKSILNKLNEVFTDENTQKIKEVVESAIYLLDDEVTERKKLESQIYDLKQRVRSLESDKARC